MTKKERKDVLHKSKICLAEVYNFISLNTETKIKSGISSELDNSLSDIELKDVWNEMYDRYGYLMNELKEKWEKEQLKDYNNGTFKQSEEFEEMKERITNLENELMKIKIQSMKPKRDLGF